MIVKNIIELNKLEVKVIKLIVVIAAIVSVVYMNNNDNKLDNNEDAIYKVVEITKEEKTEELRTSSGAFNILSNDKNVKFYYKQKNK